MENSVFLFLVSNAALLITLAYAYSLISAYESKETTLSLKVVMGFVVSAIGMFIMLAAFETESGILFDSRSVLLAGVGLFLGFIPTLIAVLFTSTVAVLLGGEAMAVGVAMIVFSGTIGLAWRYARHGELADISWRELYAFGMIVHLVSLLLYQAPIIGSIAMLQDVWIPVVILFPPATMLFGQMMALRLQRERSARLLRESEARYRSLFENNHTVMLIIDPETGWIVNANKAAEHFYGWPLDELLKKKIGEISAVMDGRVEDRVRNGRQERRVYSFSKQRAANGQLFDVEIYSDMIVLDGHEYLYALVHDITNQKQLEDQLRQAQKMEAVGWLAGGIAHDYNNKLQAIIGFAELALRDSAIDDTISGHLNEILQAAQQSAQMTMQLMAFARKQPIQPVVLNTNDTIGRMLKMLRSLIGENITLVWRPEKDAGNLLIDPSQFDRALVNLTLNARDAIDDVGEIVITTSNVRIDDDFAALIPDATSGEYVRLSVSDTGKGLSDEEMEHIFEPFFTTKDVGQGTGLGLATVYSIIRQNQGFIQVSSERGKRTTFELYFPRTMNKKAVAVNETGAVSMQGDETIMLVEDEKMVLEFVRESLRSDGYEVMAFSDPIKAANWSEAFDGDIDLLLTDIVMPGMNGQALCEKISAQRPNIKVLYMSGYTANTIINRGVLEPGIHYIQKPFSVTDISRKVRDVLDSSTPPTQELEA